MNPRLPQLSTSAPRPQRFALCAVLLVALAGTASPALAQTTGDDPSILSPYETTPPTQTTPPPTTPPTQTTPPTKTTPPPTNTTSPTTTSAPDDDGQEGVQDTQEQPAPNQPASQSGVAADQSVSPVASTGSTGRPARLALTGAEPLLIGTLGVAMLLGAGALYRRRQIT